MIDIRNEKPITRGTENDQRRRANLQFLEIAVGNVVGAPVRHRVELDAMREFHLDRSLGVSIDPRLACVLKPASKGLSPESESSEVCVPPAMT